MNSKTFAAVLALTVLLCSCSKEGTKLFEGNYSFKTSGTVYARQTSEDITTGLPGEITVILPTESGQMDLTPAGDDGRMKLTMNVTGGEILVYDASVDGDSIVIDKDSRSLVFSFPVKDIASDGEIVDHRVTALLEVSGTGTRYGNIILFRFSYSGTFEIDGTEYEIYDSDIDCRAKFNEK